MWLSNSSVGRKVVMSVTGIALVLFLTFHMAMNLVALVSASGYNAVCEFLGANWYAVAGTLALAVLFVIHLIYAFWLTMQNRRARGAEHYAVTERRKEVEWASQNMLVLGLIVILGLLLHLVNFWSNMMLPELMHDMGMHADTMALAYAADGILAGRPVVPPDPRFLERHADAGLEQQGLDQPLAVHLQHLCYHRSGLLRPGSSCVLHQITVVSL